MATRKPGTQHSHRLVVGPQDVHAAIHGVFTRAKAVKPGQSALGVKVGHNDAFVHDDLRRLLGLRKRERAVLDVKVTHLSSTPGGNRTRKPKRGSRV